MSALAEKPATDPALENAPDWVREAISLRQQGLSEREIAESVGKAASTVHAALKKYDGAMAGTPVSPEQAARLAAAASGAQTTVEEQLAAVGDVPSREELHEGSVDAGPDGRVAGAEDEDGFFDPDADPERPAAAVELEAEAGPAVGPMPPAKPKAEGTVVYVEEIRFDGTRQTALDVGGKRATTAKCSFSGKATVDGSLRKGDVLTGTFRAVVRSATSKDSVDKASGVVTDAADSFTAQLVDLVLDA